MSESVNRQIDQTVEQQAARSPAAVFSAGRSSAFSRWLTHLRVSTSRSGLIMIAVVYVILAAAFSQTLYFSRALDEGYHLEYITFIKQNGHLPATYEERAQITRADFPPLYHLLVAGLSAGVEADGPPYFKNFWDSFRYRAIDYQTENVWTLPTEDYNWPYLGRFLVWKIGRWTSVLLSLATVVVVFFSLQETPLRRIPGAALTGAALLAFIPRYLILGSALNDDNLLGLLAALYFLMLLKAIKHPENWRPYLGMGVFLGLSMTVKYTLVLIPLEVIIVCAWLARKNNLGWLWWGRRVGLVGGAALLCSSWWFGWNIWFLNTVAEEGWFVGLLRPLLAGGHDTTLNRLSGLASAGQTGLTALPEETVVGTFPQWLQSTFYSFWGVGFDDVPPFFPLAFIAIGLLLVVSAFGLWRIWRTGWPEEYPSERGQTLSNHPNFNRIENRQWLMLCALHLSLFIILPLIRFGLTRRLSVAAQGRHILIPAATVVVGLLIWGLAAMLPQRWRRRGFTVVVVGFLGWTGAHLYQLTMQGTPALLPMRTVAQAAMWLPHSVKAQFGETAELASYDLSPQPEQGVVQVTLGWRALAHTNESYLVKVRLIDAAGHAVSYWTGYNGQGRLPTLAWDPGDAIFDRLALPLPALPAGEYGVYVQMLKGDTPLAIRPADGDSAEAEAALPIFDEGLLLTKFSLRTPSNLTLPHRLRLDTPQGPLEVNFALWRADGPAQTSSIPVYRYPGTITVVTSSDPLNGAVLKIDLVDDTGQTWPARSSEANIHTFVIGPRWASGRYRLQMTLQSEAGVIAQAGTEPVLSVENWWERRFELPDIPVRVEANFADQVMFLGYKLPQRQVKAGEAFPLTLYWQAPPDKSPQADFIQFNNLLSSTGTLYGGYDRRPLEYYNTLLWAPGEIVVDGYAVPVAEDAPPGEYYLDVGYYLTVGESAVNLPLVVDGQRTEVSSVTIGPIEVVAP
jgi:4-amino-4-deoxy-L-arabinose transferase-like glycosyltransferase